MILTGTYNIPAFLAISPYTTYDADQDSLLFSTHLPVVHLTFLSLCLSLPALKRKRTLYHMQ
ncbi:hypothetical protein H1R20_g7133, partial [Candolleomyces eurysporus]